MYKIVKVIYVSITLLFSVLAILTVDAVVENIKVDNLLKNFVDNAVKVNEVGRFVFYEVEIEEELTTSSITISDSGVPNASTPGDIFVLRESVIDFIPYSAEFITFYFGGHAGMVYDEKTILETTGMEPNPEDNCVIEYRNNIFYRPEQVDVVGLRVKASDEEVKKAVDYAYSTIGEKYNYSFVFNRKNTYYCTDLITRSYGKEGNLNFNLDEDGIAVSCNDLILASDTFITYYMIYKDGYKHLYYAVNKTES